jgi:hypothetical protein
MTKQNIKQILFLALALTGFTGAANLQADTEAQQQVQVKSSEGLTSDQQNASTFFKKSLNNAVRWIKNHKQGLALTACGMATCVTAGFIFGQKIGFDKGREFGKILGAADALEEVFALIIFDNYTTNMLKEWINRYFISVPSHYKRLYNHDL